MTMNNEVTICYGHYKCSRVADASYKSIPMCRKCIARWEAREEAERKRIAAYADKAKMTWAQWAAWVAWYGLDATSDRDRKWCFDAYLEWGCALPFEAYLGDCPDLEHAMNLYSCQFVDDE